MKTDGGPTNRLEVEGWSFFSQPIICEQHPDQDWPHDDCPGPGMPRACRGAAEFSEAHVAMLSQEADDGS